MLLTFSKEGRFFSGAFDLDDSVVEGINSIVNTNNINTAMFQISGFLLNPEIKKYDFDTTKLKEPETLFGRYFISSLNGSVSITGTRRIIDMPIHLVSESGENITGFLKDAKVFHAEIFMRTFDDIMLVRQKNDKTGLMKWVSIRLPEIIPPLGPKPEEEQKIKPPSMQTSSPKEQKLPDFLFDNDSIELKRGDIVDHIRLGKCKITKIKDDNLIRVTIFRSGKLAEINLTPFNLIIEKKEGDVKYITLIPKRK